MTVRPSEISAWSFYTVCALRTLVKINCPLDRRCIERHGWRECRELSATIAATPAALLVGRSQLLPTIVRHSRRPWRSVAIVPDNCATLPPSMAVGRNCSRQLCDTPAVHGGRIQQSILTPRALLARRSNTLVVAYFILTRALSGQRQR
jgi:hypothetical protein